MCVHKAFCACTWNPIYISIHLGIRWFYRWLSTSCTREIPLFNSGFAHTHPNQWCICYGFEVCVCSSLWEHTNTSFSHMQNFCSTWCVVPFWLLRCIWWLLCMFWSLRCIWWLLCVFWSIHCIWGCFACFGRYIVCGDCFGYLEAVKEHCKSGNGRRGEVANPPLIITTPYTPSPFLPPS